MKEGSTRLCPHPFIQSIQGRWAEANHDGNPWAAVSAKFRLRRLKINAVIKSAARAADSITGVIFKHN